MSAMTTYLARHVIRHWFQNQPAATRPATLYFALFLTKPGKDGAGGVEVSGGGYARAEAVASASNFPGPVGDDCTVSNAEDVPFQTPTADWGLVVAVGIYDAPTGGNLLWSGDLPDARNVVLGDPGPTIVAGLFSVRVDDP